MKSGGNVLLLHNLHQEAKPANNGLEADGPQRTLFAYPWWGSLWAAAQAWR